MNYKNLIAEYETILKNEQMNSTPFSNQTPKLSETHIQD